MLERFKPTTVLTLDLGTSQVNSTGGCDRHPGICRTQDDLFVNHSHIRAGCERATDPLYGLRAEADSFENIFSSYVTDWDERIHPERYVYEIRDCATLGPCARMLSDEPCDCRH